MQVNWCVRLLLFSAGLFMALASPLVNAKSGKPPPNILFMVMDDVGIDQMKVFGYGGSDPAKTPNMDAIALGGVRFRNSWSSPTCSPSRAAYFIGRYNLRTNMLTAISQNDLANSATSPFEYTIPKLLRQKGYVSAVFGKMHLSGSDLGPANLPFGNETMRVLGWDHFEGFYDGGPFPIDTTAGGVSPVIHEDGSGVYGCGYVPNKSVDEKYGADSGACYQSGGGCENLTTAASSIPGKLCLEHGGIFDPNQQCQATPPEKLNFNKQNAYYTGNWVISREDGATELLPPADPRGRGYRSIQEADRTIAWIKQQSPNQPWMASVGFTAIHEPIQPPPAALLPPGSPSMEGYQCVSSKESREDATLMLEAMDHEMGRILVETGLASYNPDGSLNYQPEKTNTVVVITSDNGTWTTSVRAPFDPTRAKGTPYQTGVWVPEIVAGPMVNKPGREVSAMTNGTDLFSLFSEVAGIDVRKAVPKSHILDSEKMLPYLTNPKQAPIRKSNFTLFGKNLRAEGAAEYPCLITSMNSCTMVLPAKGVCEDQSGEWFGPEGVVAPEVYTSCCQVNEYLKSQGQPEAINPITQRAIRNGNYKIVRQELENCSGGEPIVDDEFYRINENQPIPLLDREDMNLLADGRKLRGNDKRNYQWLQDRMSRLERSVVNCPGDGNLDMVVDQKDIDEWVNFTKINEGRSSWYDFNLDGLTNELDYQIIQENFGNRCRPPNK